jgi:hypothetical protein
MILLFNAGSSWLIAVAENESSTPGILLLCAAMTLILLFYTFYSPREIAASPEKSRASFLRERKEAVYENLRDLNFEFKAGKLPEDDYRQMRASLEDEAAVLLAEIDRSDEETYHRDTEAQRRT